MVRRVKSAQYEWLGLQNQRYVERVTNPQVAIDGAADGLVKTTEAFDPVAPYDGRAAGPDPGVDAEHVLGCEKATGRTLGMDTR